jgi:hypothetical protein
LHFRIGTLSLAAGLFLAGAIGLLGPWALGTSVVLLVAMSVVTAIAWEDRGGQPAAFAEGDALVPARVDAS